MKSERQKLVEKRIEKDLENHQIEKLLDQGIYRHWKCSNNNSNILCFHIVTWPGHLCISGDMGTYVFKRTYDMIPFMRSSAMSFEYAEEKCVAIDRIDQVSDFSKDCTLDFLSYELKHEEDKNRKKLIKQLIDDIEQLYEWGEDNEYKIKELIYDTGLFDEIPKLHEYVYHFLWILYAIKWFCDKIDVYEIEPQGKK